VTQKEVVSVSIGSSSRDHEVDVELLGQNLKIRRVGTDGDIEQAKQMFRDLDDQVAAFGLGGICFCLVGPGGRQSTIRSANQFKNLTKSPMLDGTGLKNTLERSAVEYLRDVEGFDFTGKKCLMISAVDRFGMAEALSDAGCDMIFGDLIFGLGIPVAVRSMRQFRVLARIFLPAATKLPFTVLYPTGREQEEIVEGKYDKYFREADIIAGDYLYIKKYMPAGMEGKTVITNTVTAADVADMKDRGADLLVTTTPEFNGRSFGTNVMEATCVALLDKPADRVTPQDYYDILNELGFKPRLERFAAAGQNQRG
jgi:hypothetical protein